MKEDLVFETKNLSINAIRDDGSELPIVKGVDIKVPRGSVVALIGESGSGKSVTSLSAMRLIPTPPGVISGGEILFHKENIDSLNMKVVRVGGVLCLMVKWKIQSAMNKIFQRIIVKVMLPNGNGAQHRPFRWGKILKMDLILVKKSTFLKMFQMILEVDFRVFEVTKHSY